MQRTKSFIQYFEIINGFTFKFLCVVRSNGTIERKSRMYFGSEQYYINNKEKILKQTNQYHKDNREKRREWYANYYINNREEILKKTNQWKGENPEKRKQHACNRRNFGFEPINDWFEGACFHHTHEDGNHNIGIFIPADLHRSIGHNNKNQESMDRINVAAYKWLKEQYIGE